MKRRFNPSGRAAYAALVCALVIVSVLTYMLMGIAGVDASAGWYAYVFYGTVFAVGAVAVWVGSRLVVYEVSEREIGRRSGVLNREEKIIPLDKVDNISVKRSLLDSIFGLANVYIDTPAGPDYEMIMRGLTNADAGAVVEELRGRTAEKQEARERDAAARLGRVPKKR